MSSSNLISVGGTEPGGQNIENVPFLCACLFSKCPRAVTIGYRGSGPSSGEHSTFCKVSPPGYENRQPDISIHPDVRMDHQVGLINVKMATWPSGSLSPSPDHPDGQRRRSTDAVTFVETLSQERQLDGGLPETCGGSGCHCCVGGDVGLEDIVV